MADELAILDPIHGWDERTIPADDGETLLLRVAPVTPPSHPLGPGHTEPHFGIFASAMHVDPGWLVVWTVPDPDEKIATLGEDEVYSLLRLSILFGASWRAVSASVRRVRDTQEACAREQPQSSFQRSLRELRRFRSNVNSADPHTVSILLQMTEHWCGDPGGTWGAHGF